MHKQIKTGIKDKKGKKRWLTKGSAQPDEHDDDASDREMPVRDLAAVERRLFRPLRFLLKQGCFRLEVKNLDLVPLEGPIVFVSNHSGWLPLDALMLSLVIHDRLGPAHLPYFAVHKLLLQLPLISHYVRDLGLFRADWLKEPARLPPELRSIMIFPEGEAGNFKPFWQAYQMREWHCGFVNLAAQRQAQVVPLVIIGAEESLPVALSFKFFKPLIGTLLPLPLSPIPLPSRWKIVFLPPLDVSALAEHEQVHLHNPDQCHYLAAHIGPDIQATLDHEAAGRPLARLGRHFDRDTLA